MVAFFVVIGVCFALDLILTGGKTYFFPDKNH